MKDVNETIVAIATPPGQGGVGIVRVSGPKARVIAKKILKKNLQPKFAHFGFFYVENNQVIDQGIAIFFSEPDSFTGEDVLELHAHGSPIILDQLVKHILHLGARLADPGEFSRRAFLNNKIDLAQAEAVADLIAISSERAVISAVNSLQGKFSQEINKILDALIKLRTLIEASIDFAEAEMQESKKVVEEIARIAQQIEYIENAAKQGVLLREGINVVLIGEPNAGKSSLLNWLSGKNSAIVTKIAGTTRDVLREHIHIDGMPIHIIDTAGLQESENLIEQEGIKRTWQEIEKADEILLIADDSLTKETDPEKLLLSSSRGLTAGSRGNKKPTLDPAVKPQDDTFDFNRLKNKITVIKNKIDLSGAKARIENNVVYLSAKTGVGVDLLKEQIKKKVGFADQTEGLFIARRRHLTALNKAKGWLNAAKLQTQDELIAENLRLAQNNLSEITGAFTTDDLLDEIFSSFCIGK